MNFFIDYLKTACGVSNAKNIIRNLEAKNIIRYRSHSRRFILFEGTDLDIQTALIEAGNKISEVVDITTLLNRHIQFSPVFAKQYSFSIGTPRYFEFVISDYPINKTPEAEIDGFVNFVFNGKLKESDIQNKSESQDEAIIYCFFKNSTEIKNLLFEIEKIQKVLEDNKEDKVAKRELENIVESQTKIKKLRKSKKQKKSKKQRKSKSKSKRT